MIEPGCLIFGIEAFAVGFFFFWYQIQSVQPSRKHFRVNLSSSLLSGPAEYVRPAIAGLVGSWWGILKLSIPMFRCPV